MRKDLFLVGARLLGVWQLIGALNSLALILAAWAGFLPHQPGGTEYSNIRFVVELVIGLYLILKTDHLFSLLSSASQRDETGDSAQG